MPQLFYWTKLDLIDYDEEISIVRSKVKEAIHYIKAGSYLSGSKPSFFSDDVAWSELKKFRVVLHDLGTSIQTGWITAANKNPTMKKVHFLSKGIYPCLQFQRKDFAVNFVEVESQKKLIEIIPNRGISYF